MTTTSGKRRLLVRITADRNFERTATGAKEVSAKREQSAAFGPRWEGEMPADFEYEGVEADEADEGVVEADEGVEADEADEGFVEADEGVEADEADEGFVE